MWEERRKLSLFARPLTWYDEHKRIDLPWHVGPIILIISGFLRFMSQQTRVDTVILTMGAFLDWFPTEIADLAQAPENCSKHGKVWGYYSRGAKYAKKQPSR